jgi:RsiW-degrading membrane proteinase PrsW (M82 family)
MNLLMGIALSLVLGIGPMALYAVMLTWFDRYEKEPPLLMFGVFMWGLIVAAGSALILNTLFGISVFFVTGSEAAASLGAAVISAPLVEETVKGLGVLGVFLYFRHEFDSVLDGVIYGSLVGFGFAAAENVNYIFTGFSEAGLGGLFVVAFIRSVLIAFLHATFTAFTGIGLAVARLGTSALRFLAPPLGYAAAVGLHAFHNLLASVGDPLICLLGSVIDWLGFFAMFGFILFLVWREGRVMREHLRDEVARGTMSERQFEAACSVFGQMAARWGALAGGRWRQSSRFYDLCGELAFKKHQLARLGPAREPQAQATIENLRGQIAALSAGT